MSISVVDNFTTPWDADPSGTWVLSSGPDSACFGADGMGMAIDARGGAAASPFAERDFNPPLDLSGADELRLWLKSSLPADGTRSKPFYLAFDVLSGTAAPWTRLLPISRAAAWELHRLWLGDMPSSSRKAATSLRLRGLDPNTVFRAAIDDLVAVRPEPLSDVDAALLARLDKRFQVTVSGSPVDVPAFFEVPESPVKHDPPYILITPWAVTPLGEDPGSAPIIDNFTGSGAYVRPAGVVTQLDYRLEVYATDRAQKTRVLEALLADLGARRGLLVGDGLLPMTSFTPSAEERALVVPGRTPLFYRLVVAIETGVRQFRPFATPSITVAPIDGPDTAESLKVPA